jgi:uncharacterized membrane protein YfcA
MKRYDVSLPELAVIAGTRGAAGAGIGLLLADYIGPRHRRTVGWTLFAIGAISTLPLVLRVLRSSHRAQEEHEEPSPAARFTREYAS